MIDLYPFQRDSVEFHKGHHYSLNASEMGVGKSIISLTVAKELGLDPLVIAPTFLRGTWEGEAKKVGVKIRFVPYSMLHHFEAFSAGLYKIWIVDEIHCLKTPTTKRTHAFYSLLRTCLPEYFIGMTGTPIKNKVPDLWTLLAFCNLNQKLTSGMKLPPELSKYHAFSRYFCKVEEMKLHGRRIQKYGSVKDEKIPELKALLKNKMIRYRVEDVLHDLPDLTRRQVPTDIKSTIDVELAETFDAYTQGHKVNPTAKRQSALLKSAATVEYCKELIEGGSGPLVIFSDHVESIQNIASGLSNSRVITGSTSMADRQKYVEQFQADTIKVIAATIGAMSVGVTLTAARHVVFNDMSWVPADNLQAEKRIHRIGQKNACVAHFIQSTPTDAYILKTLISKMDTINKVID